MEQSAYHILECALDCGKPTSVRWRDKETGSIFYGEVEIFANGASQLYIAEEVGEELKETTRIEQVKKHFTWYMNPEQVEAREAYGDDIRRTEEQLSDKKYFITL
jgi:hypothetical protein